MFYRHPRKNSGDDFVENLKVTLNKVKKINKHNYLQPFKT